MANYFYIPYCNPVPFYQVDVPAVPGKNFVHLDEDWFSKQIQGWEQSIQYFQPWQQTDVVRIQVQSEISPVRLDLIDCRKTVIKTVDFTLKPTSIIGQLWQVYEAEMQLADVDEGLYYFLITAGFGSNIMQFISEPADVQLSHPGTMLYTYKNSINALDVIYTTGIEFGFRCESIVADYNPGNKSAVYEDQTLNLVELSAYPFDDFKLKIGGSYGVPNWVAKKINMIFCNDFVLLDQRQYVRADGAKMESSRADRYPMCGWNMDIRPASNRFSGIYDDTFDDQVAVAYNIEAGIFGTMNGQPSDLEIIILERK